MSSSTSSSTPTSVFSPSVPTSDVARGTGVVLVVLYHMGYQAFMNAWVDISLFFALSGFLITKTTIEAFERNGHVDIVKFWSKRVSRIFPCVLLVIILIVLSQKLPFRHNDGVTYQREASDLWYATIFATNYNLVYLQPDDYFDEFSAPSITRHLWTLSIEEQYYVIWPLVIWSLSQLVFLLHGKERKHHAKVSQETMSQPEDEQEISQSQQYLSSGEDGNTKKDHPHENEIFVRKDDESSCKPYLLESTTVRNLIRCVFLLDLCVMILSYFSSWATIDAMGLSAAYYSTWCRMGDIAAGGFAYTGSRLQPYVARRWYRDPTLPPLTKAEQIICEMMSFFLFCCVFILPMVQTPVKDMFVMYFSYLRLGISLTAFGCVFHTILVNEGIPKWAIFAKFCNSKVLGLFGTLSYGAYVIHWPILVFFGDPNGRYRHLLQAGVELDQDTTVFQYNLMNVFFFFLTFAIAYVSFFKFELPLLMKSRNTVPWKTVMTGLSAMGVTLMTIWFVTKDLPPMMTFENDIASDQVVNIDSAIAAPVMERDHRFTPIAFIATTCLPLWPILDSKTKAKERCYRSSNALTVDMKDVFNRSDAKIIIQCKNQANENPCAASKRVKKNLYWFWIESDRLCGRSPIPPESRFSAECPNTFQIKMVQPPSENPFSTKNSTEVKIQLYEMLDTINERIPGVINQNSVSQFKREYHKLLHPHEVQFDEGLDPIRITMIGESVGMRIGMYWKEYLNFDLPSLGYTPDDSELPSLKTVTNMAFSSTPAITYWLCKHPSYRYDFCDTVEKMEKVRKVMNSFKTKPNIVAIHDQYWAMDRPDSTEKEPSKAQIFADSTFDRVLAFNLMVSDALDNGVDSIVYLTRSPCLMCTGEKASKQYIQEIDSFMAAIDTLACSDDVSVNDDGLEGEVFDDDDDKVLTTMRRSMKVGIVDWAKLICPHIGDGNRCPKFDVYGFDDILPDNQHPYGDSGEWLTRRTLSIVLAKYGIDHGYYSSLDDALGNPMSTQLLTPAPSDGYPPLEDLLTSFTICPYDDLKQLEDDLNMREEKNYKSFRDSAYHTNKVEDEDKKEKKNENGVEDKTEGETKATKKTNDDKGDGFGRFMLVTVFGWGVLISIAAVNRSFDKNDIEMAKPSFSTTNAYKKIKMATPTFSSTKADKNDSTLNRRRKKVLN